MKFDTAQRLEEVIWYSRLAEVSRGENRRVLQILYNGNPPFSPEKAEEDNIEINHNDLSGVNLLAQSRRQWNNAMLGGKNYFTINLDSGPKHKRNDWGRIITKNINRLLKRHRPMMEQRRATGANVMLYGPGPCNWRDAHNPVPDPIAVSSLLIADDTDIDFENLEWFSVFREWTPGQLWEMTHGVKVDPGWQLPAVNAQLKRVANDYQKQANATSYQYMPEKIEEELKQSGGLWWTDAVPTIDVWDTYFREAEDGKGWYRRILLDWGISPGSKDMAMPRDKNADGFLYTSGKRKYASELSEVLHCQFADCSAVAPFKYHSVRSLGWMLWGVCDLQNRLHCRFNETVFQNMMWLFRVASEQQMQRLKRADFYHMGVIPNGVSFVPKDDRFTPDMPLIEMAFGRNQSLMQQAASSFSQSFDKNERGKDPTATEVMAVVNSQNALVSGMMALAYEYESYKDREICRRFCKANSKNLMVQRFRRDCLRDGVPAEMLAVDRWEVNEEKVLAGGNKTLEMATVQFLNTIRKNVGPQGQRIIDHLSVFSATDQPDLADQIAPLDEVKTASNSTHDAQLSTDRLMRGLPLKPLPDMVYEDYVQAWLADLAMMVTKAQGQGGMATADQIAGFANINKHIEEYLQIMATDEENVPKIKQYQDALGQIMNLVKAFAQRLAQQQKAAQGGNGAGDAETQTKLRGKAMIDQAKAANMRESHAARTAQKQVSFELEQQRKDRESAAQIRRQGQEHLNELAGDHMRQRASAMNSMEE